MDRFMSDAFCCYGWVVEGWLAQNQEVVKSGVSGMCTCFRAGIGYGRSYSHSFQEAKNINAFNPKIH